MEDMRTTTETRSALFTAYNAARTVEGVDRERLNRALGVAQLRSQPDYGTTLDHCGCPDTKYRPWVVCKHRLALVLTR